jgi:hypothetical protein
MKTHPPVMKIDSNDKTVFSVEIPPGSERMPFGLLIHDFAAFELSGFEEGVELKTRRWMQEQTSGPLNERQTVRAIEGWRMRMRREFLGWGCEENPDSWNYIPVALREWRDMQNPSAKWRENPVLFLWRCQLWQARLRGCDERSALTPDPEEEMSSWEEEYGWIYAPIDNEVVWNPEKRVAFEKVPVDVAEFLIRDRELRNAAPHTPPIWDNDYEAHGQMEAFYRFEAWSGPENWTPPGNG